MSFRIVGRHAALLVLLPLLAACASLAPQAPPQAPAASASTPAVRPFHHTLDLSGRLSVQYQGERQPEALHGSFSWAQMPSRTVVTLLSPLGQTIAVINVSPQGASLSQGGQETRSAPNVDTLTADALGWPLPVAGLRDWLQGFAIDANGNRFVATPESSEVVTRDGWHIRYANWQQQNGYSLPKRIDLARTTEQAGDVSIRIVIDSWQIL